jgi:hypothetical protein
MCHIINTAEHNQALKSKVSDLHANRLKPSSYYMYHYV